MERLKKLYSITELTNNIIKQIAKEQCVPESYALDNIVQSFYRMTHKNQPVQSLGEPGTDEYYKNYSKNIKKNVK